ncbi:NYN domain-containing protein [Aspergillus undulatus]|uniref:NYN domain-containing protein n=1 Tax=Aspergillus undulatus TaxID=1810928 RepID=UPI003CCDD29D
MIPSSASSSNWDFTAVINLLQSPTYPSQDCSTFSNPPNHPNPQPASHTTIKHDVEKPDIKKQSLKDEHVSSPKLGDFGSLWDALGNARSTPPASTNIEHYSRHREFPQPPQPPQWQNPSVTILKRPKASVSSLDNPAPTLATPASVPVITTTGINSPPYGHVNAEPSVPAQRRRGRKKSNDETSLSESNAEGESDNSLSVFDPPLSKPRSIRPMIPPQVGVPEAQAGPLDTIDTPPSSFDEVDGFLAPSAVKYPPSAGVPRLRPLDYKTAVDQRVGLLTKLMKDFPDYTELLIEAGRSKKSKKLDISSRPIHVFVDMSNIMVGFHDTMKISRNIPVQTRIRRLPMSYQNLSLILERGRPTAKRVLVGSDRIAAINESEQLGYEANILNRVQKVKQLTPRQLKFRKNPKATSDDGGNGSETNDAPEERWVEQGVDEILHLKILESLLDTDEPATIVLATGDAAEAEFSGGFMKMVERALQRGWRVELVSFSQVMSYAYKKKEFRSRWGSQFQMIILDDYVEELFKM